MMMITTHLAETLVVQDAVHLATALAVAQAAIPADVARVLVRAVDGLVTRKAMLKQAVIATIITNSTSLVGGNYYAPNHLNL